MGLGRQGVDESTRCLSQPSATVPEPSSERANVGGRVVEHGSVGRSMVTRTSLEGALPARSWVSSVS